MLQFNNQQIEGFKDYIARANNIVLVSHVNADGDAVGSTVGFMHVLRSLGKRCVVMLPNGVPDYFMWLPGSKEVYDYEKQTAACDDILQWCDLVVVLDMNTLSRADDLGSAVAALRCPKLMIDHHVDPDKENLDIVISFDEMSSTCELATWLLPELFGNDALTRDAAVCLYTGICTDTGCFSYSCESPTLFEAAAKLVSFDIDPAGIHNNIENVFSEARLRFFGFAITERLVVDLARHYAYFYISLEDMRRFGVDKADLEGLVNYTLKMKDVLAGALIREEENRVKLSFRSKSDVNIRSLVVNNFEVGGGHEKAAGATSFESFEATKAKVERLLSELVK